jgi:ADP-ribose pyrophosphatase YjhB (NUDIX family)
MHKQHKHCSYCGEEFAQSQPWPRECRACGNKSYLNPLPVVVMLVPLGTGLVVVRRNIEPQKGTLTLPGGYLDMGESWQQGGKREFLEETGIDIGNDCVGLYEVMNGLDGTLIVFGLAAPQPLSALKPFSSEETQEVLLIEGPMELGFSMHTQVVARFFQERSEIRS